MTHIFLSPHFDDAVYSCGATIYQLTQSGADVRMITIMAGSPRFPLPDTPVLKDNHTRWQAGDNPVIARQEEDQAAARILGAQVQYLDIPDCIYRVVDGIALYPDEASLWGSPHALDFAQEALDRLNLNAQDTIYAPLGVGDHVDHQLVRNWTMQFMMKHPLAMVYFYEDYPYMRQRESVQAILASFPRLILSQTSIVDAVAMQVKIEAMRAYRSQIASFWSDESQIDEEVRATFKDASGQWVERFYSEAR